jgi:hypothetical protein
VPREEVPGVFYVWENYSGNSHDMILAEIFFGIFRKKEREL